MAAGPALDSSPSIRRSAERRWTSLTPSNRFNFVCEGGPGVPDFYEELAGRGDGPPLHRHPWASWELVLEGRIRVRLGDEDHLLDAGDLVYIPPGVPHTYVVESEAAHVVGVGLSGGRFATLQREAVAIFAAEGGPDMERVGALAASVDVELLGPPLAAKG